MGFLDRIIDAIQEVEPKDVLPRGTFLENLINPRGPIFKEGAVLDPAQVEFREAPTQHVMDRMHYDVARGITDWIMDKYPDKKPGELGFSMLTPRAIDKRWVEHMIAGGYRPETTATSSFDPVAANESWSRSGAYSDMLSYLERVRSQTPRENIQERSSGFIDQMLAQKRQAELIRIQDALNRANQELTHQTRSNLGVHPNIPY